MNAAETIQAAIDRLAYLNAATAPGPWSLGAPEFPWSSWDEGDVPVVVNVEQLFSDRPAFLHHPGSFAESDGGFDRLDADLIVTLHRTIDAQLAILRAQLHIWEGSIAYRAAVLDLARAILGEDA